MSTHEFVRGIQHLGCLVCREPEGAPIHQTTERRIAGMTHEHRLLVVKVLRAYANEHYKQGGDWVVNTFDAGDFLVHYIEHGDGDIERAKQMLSAYWNRAEAAFRREMAKED